MIRRHVGSIIYIEDRPRHISGSTTRIESDYTVPDMGVDFVERVQFTYINGVCKMDVEGRKYAFRTKKARLLDDLRVVLGSNDAMLEKYRMEERK